MRVLNNAERTDRIYKSKDIQQDFASSLDPSDAFPSSWAQKGTGDAPSNGHPSELNWWGLTEDSKEIEFGTCLWPEPFSAASGIYHSQQHQEFCKVLLTHSLQCEASSLDRYGTLALFFTPRNLES